MAQTFVATMCVCAVSLLGGCLSIPLSTIWKLRDLTVVSFFKNEPAQLRVALQVDRAMKRGPAQPKLQADLTMAGRKPLCHAFSLDPIDPSARTELVLEQPAPGRVWSVFALSPAGIDAFKRAQREIADIPKGTEGQFNFGVTMTDVFVIGDDARNFPIRVDIALNRKDGYFTLIKETTIEIEKSSKSSKSTPPVPTSLPANACPET